MKGTVGIGSWNQRGVTAPPVLYFICNFYSWDSDMKGWRWDVVPPRWLGGGATCPVLHLQLLLVRQCHEGNGWRWYMVPTRWLGGGATCTEFLVELLLTARPRHEGVLTLQRGTELSDTAPPEPYCMWNCYLRDSHTKGVVGVGAMNQWPWFIENINMTIVSTVLIPTDEQKRYRVQSWSNNCVLEYSSWDLLLYRTFNFSFIMNMKLFIFRWLFNKLFTWKDLDVTPSNL